MINDECVKAGGLACPEHKLSCSMCTVDEVSNLVEETETLLVKGSRFGVFLQGGSDMQGLYSCNYLAVFLPYTTHIFASSHPNPESLRSPLTISYSCLSYWEIRYHSIHAHIDVLTLFHRFLIELPILGAPPDSISLPLSVTSHAVHATFLGLLSPQLPFDFALARVATRMASLASVHFELVLASVSSSFIVHWWEWKEDEEEEW